MSTKKRYLEFKEEVGQKCTLVAVSKRKSNEMILEAYQAGLRDLGENRVQELVPKYEVLPKDIRWHMIGHLQRNKVKFIAPFVYLIHSVDSFKLLEEINKQALRNQRVISCLLQIHIATETTKFGFSTEEVTTGIQSEEFNSLKNIKIKGFMGMATFTENAEQTRQEFKSLKSLFDRVKKNIQAPNLELTELSMGMTDDYQIALEEGSTMIRVGQAIFGPRE